MALKRGNVCIPNGYGTKIYIDLKIIESFFQAGDVGNIAWISNPNHHIYFGCEFNEVPNGWGLYLVKGLFTFGYYKDGNLYKDLSPFATDLYLDILKRGIQFWHIEDINKRLVLGSLPNEKQPFIGFHFLENGTVYLGYGNNNNDYNLTGHYIRLDIDGTATFGEFQNGKIVNSMNQSDYLNQYTKKRVGAVNIDLKSDYLKIRDSGLYYLIKVETVFDSKKRSLLSIKALSFDVLLKCHEENIHFKDNQVEYFYLQTNETEVTIINKKLQLQRLWKVNLNDFHTHIDYLNDFLSEIPVERYVHLHNKIIGLEYMDYLNFDSSTLNERLLDPHLLYSYPLFESKGVDDVDYLFL